MYLIGVLLLAGMAVLAFLSRREEGDPIIRMAIYVYKKGCIHKNPLLNVHYVQKDLETLHPGQAGLILQKEYYVRKLRMLILVLSVGTLLGILVGVKTDMESTLKAGGELQRPEPGQGDWKVELQAFMQGEKLEDMLVTIPERKLTEQEVQLLYEEFWDMLKTKALGNNPSWQQVSDSLVLEEEWEGYPFTVSWHSSNYEVLSSSGKVHNPDEPVGVTLTVVSSYLEYSWQEDLELQIIPMPLTESQTLMSEVWEAYFQAEENSAASASIPLPRELRGETLTWKENRENYSLVWMLLTLVTASAVYFFQDKDLHRQVLARREQMLGAYPVILSKLTMYLGAGMTIRGAFRKITADYGKRQDTVDVNPIYEEMAYACNQLRAGVSESQAYELWAARTGLQDYARLSTMLNQNLKKGNATLLTRLKEEGDKALQQDLNMRRRKGEEAGTKLLVPMIMMMAVVMVLVMIPAFQSFGL